MNDTESLLKYVRGQLRDGAIQAADDTITEHLKKLAEEQAAAAGAIPPPPPPRAPNAVLSELLGAIVDLLGSPYKLETLLAEFDQVL